MPIRLDSFWLDWLGRVAFAGSYWPARTLAPATLEAGDICEVIGNCNITVIIRPLAPSL